MDQQTKPSLSSKLQVTNRCKSPPLMTFAELSGKAVEGTVAVTVPLDNLCESVGYQEFWSDGQAVTVEPSAINSLLKTVETAEHLVMSYQCNALALFDAVSQVYQDAYTVSAAKGFHHLIRTWNYIDEINSIENGIERYQTFCVARHQVLEQLQLLESNNPAATAIGGHNGENVFIFLFSKTAGRVVENKRQVSAWQYPKQYAPKQPRFSRAMQCGDVLLCSGTASVVGHETKHLGDLSAQFDECMINVQALIDESGMETPLNQGLFRFYVRDRSLVNQMLARIQAHKIADYVVLAGDICRENLLIECEAVFQSVQKTVKLD